MSIELRPLGVTCNLNCHYCYQDPQRNAGNLNTRYNLDKMKVAALKYGRPFTLFGGEPLLMDFDDLENLFAWGLKKFGYSHLQTNGLLITDRHISLFNRYKVYVGISIDGPESLNNARWNRSEKETLLSTKKIQQIIETLCKKHEAPGIIITLHQGNGTKKNREELFNWIRHLSNIGIRNVRLHLLEVDSKEVRNKWALTEEENTELLLDFLKFQNELPTLSFDLNSEIEQLLKGDDSRASCVWHACDPYTTNAVQGIEGNGESSNCGRTNKDGIDYIKADQVGFERYIALYNTPQEDGGCQDCNFFLMCKGQCPGTSIGSDWRNRSEHCGTWKTIFSTTEEKIIQAGEVPLTKKPIRKHLEKLMLTQWSQGRNKSLNYLYTRIKRSPNVPLVSYNQIISTDTVPFQRICWVSANAKNTWLPRIEEMRSMLEELPLRTIDSNGKLCAFRRVRGQRLNGLYKLAAEKKIGIVVLSSLPKRYEQALKTREKDLRFHWVLSGNPQLLRKMKVAWETQEWNTFVEGLDLPSSYRKAFLRFLTCKGEVSYAEIVNWSSDVKYPEEHQMAYQMELSWWPLALQFNYDQEAKNWIEKMKQSALEYNFDVTVHYLNEFLSMPIEWTGLHGIAEIKTPIYKISSNCSYTATKQTVIYEGSRSPKEAASGLRFPFLLKKRSRLKIACQ
ncbi:MAG: radical SAM protein [Flavobacteriales bacterium]|nr:radical SAM protein [Flavobacteriales bacterium]